MGSYGDKYVFSIFIKALAFRGSDFTDLSFVKSELCSHLVPKYFNECIELLIIY